MNNKKKLLVLTSTFPRWKGDKEPPFVFELCRRLTARFDVLVLAPHAYGAQLHEVMDGVEIKRFRYFFPRGEELAYAGGIVSNLQLHPLRYLLLPGFFLCQLISLYRILRTENFDAIHIHWLIPQGLTVAIIGTFIKKMPPVLCTSHGGDLLGLNGRLWSKVKRWVIGRIQYLTVVSHAMLVPARALGANPDKISVIPMGVDTRERFVPSDSSRQEYRLLFVGRLVTQKGLSKLVCALPRVLEKFPKIELDIVGSGPELPNLQKQATELGIVDAVHFHGAKDNSEIPTFFHRSTMLVMPSVSSRKTGQEGLGLVLVEALACECPVIASDLPGVRDVVSHQQTGWLVPEKSADAIANAVIELLRRPELRNRLARNGRAHIIKNFDWDKVAAEYSNLVNTLSEMGNSKSPNSVAVTVQ